MADNFTQFSEVLDDLSPNAIAWFRRQLDAEALKKLGDINPGDRVPTEYADMALAHYMLNEGSGLCGPDFSFEIEEGKGEAKGSVWFYSEEYGSLEPISELVQAYLKEFEPNRCWGMAAAYTCSKPRAGEFGGVAVFVTAKKVTWMSTNDWLWEHEHVFKARHGGKGK